jgi:hypothetical protein
LDFSYLDQVSDIQIRCPSCKTLIDTFGLRWKEKQKMKTWNISCDWQVCAIAKVEAETLEEAIKLAKNDDNFPLPTYPDYIDESFKINKEMSKILN